MFEYNMRFSITPANVNPSELIKSKADADKKKIEDLREKFENNGMTTQELVQELRNLGATDIFHLPVRLLSDPINVGFTFDGTTYMFTQIPAQAESKTIVVPKTLPSFDSEENTDDKSSDDNKLQEFIKNNEYTLTPANVDPSELIKSKSDADKKKIEDLREKFENNGMTTQKLVQELRNLGATDIFHLPMRLLSDPINVGFTFDGTTYMFTQIPEQAESKTIVVPKTLPSFD